MISEPISAWELANAVSGFAVIFAGGLTLLLSLLMGHQPTRWLAVYAAVVLTGVPTVWFHGFGEQFIPRVADIGTNLLLGWLLQVAALWDYAERTHPRVQWAWAIISGLINFIGISWIYLAGENSGRSIFIFGTFGGFSVGETLLILDSLLATGLLFAKHAQIPPRARPLLYLQTAIFLAGALLASGSNSQVLYRIVAFHALWHLTAAFGFVALWAFNHQRFVASAPPAVLST
jgi:hypothetical protein